MKSKRLRVTLDGQRYDVEVNEVSDESLRVSVNGEIYHLSVEDISNQAGAKPAADNLPKQRPASEVPSESPGILSAPMPGDIVEIKVKVGEKVEPGQVIAVLEAMKMKNMLRVAQAGIVAEIMVSVGQSVEFGVPLVRFEA